MTDTTGPKIRVTNGGRRRAEIGATRAPRIKPAPNADWARPMRAGSRQSGPSASGAHTASKAKKAKFQKIAQRLKLRSRSWRTTKWAPARIELRKDGRSAWAFGAATSGKARMQAKAKAAPHAASA